MKKLLYIFTLAALPFSSFAQLVPSKAENIDFLVTFGNKADKTLGDDDNTQTYFFAIPESQKKSIYIRVFDPEISGKNDNIIGEADTRTKFTVYGGAKCYSEKDARRIDPVGNYKSGVVLSSKVFDKKLKYDDRWFAFGPFNPKEGEFDKDLNAYVFKIIVEGIDGDDGNAYKFFLSKSESDNKVVEGGNAFAYEVSFRLLNKGGECVHFYPFIDKNVVSINQQNFDFDKDGDLRLNSVSKKSHILAASGDGEWKNSSEKITEAEHNTSLDLQLLKKTPKPNDMVMYLTNQYNEAIPFFSVPIGGVPKYKYKVDVQYKLPE
jgi:hypothetical protein